MKTAFYILTIIFILTSCDFKTKILDKISKKKRENFEKEIKIINTKILAWENLVDSFYKIADTNQQLAFNAIDKLIISDTSLDKHKICVLHFIKGDIYYRIDSLHKAIEEFTKSGQINNVGTPKVLAARAGAFIKLKQFEKAFCDLNKAAEINYYYYWNLGNYYEIIGKKDSAIAFYNRLLLKDTIIHKQCKDRIIKLKNPKTKPFNELIYLDRFRKGTLFK